MTKPVVSVIVPARNAATTLRQMFDALAAGDFDRPWEIVLVDDASTDDTPRIAERAGARVVRLAEQQGPAAARNAGIAASRAELLAFTDADCVPSTGWLSAVVAALEHADVVMGPVSPEPGVAVGPFDRALRLNGRSPRFETANLAVRRSVAEAVGGFEPFVPAPGRRGLGLRPTPDQGHFGEDAVFGWRARRRGARVTFAEEALVHHAVFPRRARHHVAERWRLRFFPSLVRELPELRATLTAGVFLSPRTARFDAAVLGTVLAARRRSLAPLALAVPYARRDLQLSRPVERGAVKVNVALVAGDVVGLAALIRGAIAARRPLL